MFDGTDQLPANTGICSKLGVYVVAKLTLACSNNVVLKPRAHNSSSFVAKPASLSHVVIMSTLKGDRSSASEQIYHARSMFWHDSLSLSVIVAMGCGYEWSCGGYFPSFVL